MIKNYFKLAWRNFRKTPGHSFINIAGLAVGIAVVTLIALWIWNEVSFDRYHQHYDHIAQVMQKQTFNGQTNTIMDVPLPLAPELRANYANGFKYLVMSTFTYNHILTVGDNKILTRGNFMEPDGPEMLTLKMLDGSRDGLRGSGSIMLSRSLARTLFGNGDPINKTMMIDNKMDVKVTGVYDDLPENSSFKDMNFIAPWDLYFNNTAWLKGAKEDWGLSAFQLFAQTADQADMGRVSASIKNAKLNRIKSDDAKYKPEIFLQPMSKWHLYSEFKNGVNVGGKIEFVWLFGIIGTFVLLLACINFMNLSTARSEKRAREVGIRKAIGSLRAQLISQFFIESIMIAFFAFVLSIGIVLLILPFFNRTAGENISIPWGNPVFWLSGIGFSIFTGLIAGSYPAFYLSSFQAVKVLKGTFKVGRNASLPRKMLVVLQFSVSIILIIGTIIVYNQIQYAKNRPSGYSRDNLISINMRTGDAHRHYDALRYQLMDAGVVSAMAESSSPTTDIYDNSGGMVWEGKDPNMTDQFATVGVTYDYGKTVGWQFLQGRDFSTQLKTDSTGIVINDAAVKYMNLKEPIGKTVRWNNRLFTIIGVVRNMVMESPYQPVKQTIFYIDSTGGGVLNIKLNSAVSTADALTKIETTYKSYAPNEPFIYKFADEEYAKKFADEQRIGRLAAFFSTLAIFISCLGLFGMASFMSEQRTKEIGIRKTLGATTFNLWALLSREFVIMVIISLVIAAPVSYVFMHHWLEQYSYRTEIAWWVFVFTGLGCFLITLLTVSYQALRAALANPVKSLRSE